MRGFGGKEGGGGWLKEKDDEGAEEGHDSDTEEDCSADETDSLGHGD